jgi:homeobox-leucine zipper protein
MFQPNLFDTHNHVLDMTPKSPENELGKIREDDYETKSGTETMEAPSGEDQDPSQRAKRKRYHRHTQRQIQEMEK